MEWIAIDELKPNAKNPNFHSQEQIDRLAELIKYQGWRLPIIVSKLSGCIVSGHGRLEAAKKLGLKMVPVVYQDFLDADQEYAFLVSDNAISSWAVLDLSAINTDIGDLDPSFNINYLGIKDFKVDVAEKFDIQEIEEKPKQYIVASYLNNEMEMQDLFDDLTSKGIQCKLIT